MEYVLDTLQTHIVIDMVNHRNDGLFESVGLLDDERKLLYEEHGVFNGCEELAKEISQKILSAKDNGKFRLRIIPRSQFISEVLVNITDINGASYDSDSRFNENLKYDPLVINVGQNVTENEELVPILMHELTHAYEDWLRKSHNSDSIKTIAVKSGYGLKNGECETDEEYALQYIFYYFSDFELNAYVAEILGEFDKCKTYFLDISEAMNWIKNTRQYQNYLTVLSYAEHFLNVNDRRNRKKVLECANSMTKFSFKDYRQFKRWLRNKVGKVKERLNRTIPKYAAKRIQVFRGLLSPKEGILKNIKWNGVNES